mmetsp:Transcript_8030/g.18767  ORF Transcript_8030/g.18767 Transcript_8030/m.18767 type:complete len:84 (-) Transcript_8030:80-331(-)
MGATFSSSSTNDGMCFCGRFRLRDPAPQEGDILYLGSNKDYEVPLTPAAVVAGENAKGDETTRTPSTSASPSGWWWDSFIDRG